MLNIKQIVAMWIGILLTAWMWIGAASFPAASEDERVDSRYALGFALVTLGAVLSLADRKKKPD